MSLTRRNIISHRRLRLVRIFKGQQELAVEQAGEVLGPNIKAAKKDDTTEEVSTDMVVG